MNKLVMAMLLLMVCLVYAKDCTTTLEVKCVDDIRKAYPACQEAAKEKGSDTAADINCMKYYHGMQADCWPCICYVAKNDNITIKGC